MRIEYSDEYRAEMDRWERKEKRKARNLARQWKAVLAECATDFPWLPIEKCPFEAVADGYDFSGAILVTDGKKIALADVHRRFGRPIYWTGDEPPEHVLRDGIFYLEGDGEFKEPDNPEWWFKWQFTDVFGSMNYAGGDEIGKDEIEFVPTHWFPLRAITTPKDV